MTRRTDGSLTVELVVLAPVVALFGLLALGFGRYELVRAQVIGAAHTGADAAAVASDAATAVPAAEHAVAPEFASESHACPDPTVSTVTSSLPARTSRPTSRARSRCCAPPSPI